MQLVQYHDLGKISYLDAWDYQTYVQQKLLHNKLKFREKDHSRHVHHLMFCEHNPVYTLGKTGSMDHLLLNESELTQKGIEFFPINRGGDITYHGPGQLTIYPVFNLELFYRDVHRYIRELEEVIIIFLADYGLKAIRQDGYTGVWLEDLYSKNLRKICAIGVHISKWVTLHGLALNLNTDLQYFKNIIPCGIREDNRDVTSLSAELNQSLDLSKSKEKIKAIFAQVFNYEYIN